MKVKREKVLTEISGQRKVLRAEPFYCEHCKTFCLHVFVKKGVLPAGREDLLPDGKTVHICLVCLEEGCYRHRVGPIFRELSLVHTVQLTLAVSAASA